ncbi:vWA domain-containing protein [Azohydromonas caseinilytica]|uniref:vWA domain-containing protein n=1 Tax=Azohydromonas caseinilytica TaxID=2728836 RepID=UPI00197B24A8|nr:vWA domain-containing protein [Azohydromonas caseinilytica]
MSLSLDQPLWLLLLPLALLPWRRPGGLPVIHGALALLPPDPVGQAIALGLRVLGSVAIAALVLALAGLRQPERVVQRVGRGAEIVLLLDRSASMDQGFNSRAAGGSGGLSAEGGGRGRAKSRVAREVLSEFVAQRSGDRFGLVAFSSVPMPVLDFTGRTAAVQAAIAAGGVGRGLGETDIGQAVQAALDYFDERRFGGARIVLLVSDGGDHLEPAVRERITQRMRRNRVSLYWLYLRSTGSPGLVAEGGDAEAASNVPEVFLHRFFSTLGPQYRAYEVGDPAALQRAVADVARQADLPSSFDETLPPRRLDGLCLALALGAGLLLWGAQCLQRARWA